MRALFFFLLFAMPAVAGASAQAPAASAARHLGIVEETAQKRGLFQRIIEKQWHKRLKKAAGRMGRSDDADGSWLITAGLGAVVLGFLSFILIFYTGLYLPMILGALGLLLCVTGLVLASRWRDPATPRWIAILGIVASVALLAISIALV